LISYQKIVYVQIYENRFECLFLPKGNKRTINSEKPFSSSKLLIADFDLADKVLSKAIATNRWWFPLRYLLRESIIIMHQRENADQLCPTEIKILEELAYGSGASYKAGYVWVGAELSDEDIRNGVYKNS
jgi:hypothetical protein